MIGQKVPLFERCGLSYRADLESRNSKSCGQSNMFIFINQVIPFYVERSWPFREKDHPVFPLNSRTTNTRHLIDFLSKHSNIQREKTIDDLAL
jgi:hypothetical protein